MPSREMLIGIAIGALLAYFVLPRVIPMLIPSGE